MMLRCKQYTRLWWHALTHPEEAAKLLLENALPIGFTRFLAAIIVFFYGLYGTSMGLFLGIWPAAVSGIKMPLLYGFTLIICYPSLYHLNGLLGPKLSRKQTLQLLLLALSANAIALASYVPFSYFFTLTSSPKSYHFLVMMHVIVFAAAGLLSLLVVAILFRATAAGKNIPLRPAFIAAWGILYAFVGTQMAWMLRPWIGNYQSEYQILRPIQGSFIEAVWNLLHALNWI